MKSLIDRVQIWLYLGGFNRLASFLGRWGSVPQLAMSNEDDRITLPEVYEAVSDEELEVLEVRAGPGWVLDEFEVGHLRIVNFDPTFHKNQGIDVSNEVAFGTDKLDVN